MAQLAAAFAAALKDPDFAAAVVPHGGAPTESPATLTTDEAAAFLRLPAATVRLYARQERLPAYKVGRQWLFFRDDLEAALRANRLAA